ncbi:MAG: class I SAM-dependent methyltransferase, partial [archaeon]
GFLISRIDKRNIVFGLDLSKKRVKRAKNKIKDAILIQGSVLQLPFKENSFDAVICSELLEHVKEYKKALNELIRISDKVIVLTVPNDQEPRKIVCPKCGFEHFLDGHVNSFNEESISKIIESNKKIKLLKIKKFHTIFTYNKLTLHFPKEIRMFLDWIATKFERPFTFLKPNYLLVLATKKT